MTSLPLQLRGSLIKLQRAAAKFYSQLQQRFVGNSLVSESWAAMSNDLQAQAESLKKLPSSFWQSLKKQEKELIRATELLLPEEEGKPAGSLQLCLVQTLDLEEPMIIKIYALLIRRLRVEWTERALDFYVMVKAHIARLARLIQAYSGDPALSLRCAILFHDFEKEVQEPAVIESEKKSKKSVRKKAVALKKPARSIMTRRVRVKEAKRSIRALEKLSKRAKPLVKKIAISRRRARR